MGQIVVLRRSRLLALYLFALHAVAAGCVLRTDVDVRIALALGLAVAASGLRNWTLWKRPGSCGVTALRLLDDGSLRLCSGGAGERSARVLHETSVFAHAVAIVVRMERDGRRRSVIVLPDSCSGEQFRVLRTWLRWCARTVPTSPSG